MKHLIQSVLRRFGYKLQALPASAPRSWRPEWLPAAFSLQSESAVHRHVPAERAELFLALNTATTEIEVLNWLHATVCLLKPASVLETGAADGLGTLALASACKANRFGKVHSVEISPALCARLDAFLRAHGVREFAEIHCASTLEFLPATDLRFELGFYDSLCEIRAKEYEICLQRGLLAGPAIFHDTSPTRTQSDNENPPEALHGAYRQRLRELSRATGTTGCFESTLSRGLFVIYRG